MSVASWLLSAAVVVQAMGLAAASWSCANTKTPPGCSLSADCLSLSCGFSNGDIGSVSVSLGLKGLCDQPPTVNLGLNADGVSFSQAVQAIANVAIPGLSFEGQGAILKLQVVWASDSLVIDMDLDFCFLSDCILRVPLLQQASLGISRSSLCPDCPSKQTPESPTLATVAAISLLIGLFFCFAGYRFFKPMLFFIGFFVASITAYEVSNKYVPLNGEDLEVTSICVALASGVAGGSFMLFLLFKALFIIGGVFGGSLLLLGFLVTRELGWASDHLLIVGILLLIFFFVGGCMALIFEKPLIILTTALVGSFACMAAIDYVSENGRAVVELKSLFASHTFSPPSCWTVDVMIAVWPTLFVLGSIVQFCVTGRHWDHRKGRVVVRNGMQRSVPWQTDDDDDDSQFEAFNREFPMGSINGGRLEFVPQDTSDRNRLHLSVSGDERISISVQDNIVHLRTGGAAMPPAANPYSQRYGDTQAQANAHAPPPQPAIEQVRANRWPTYPSHPTYRPAPNQLSIGPAGNDYQGVGSAIDEAFGAYSGPAPAPAPHAFVNESFVRAHPSSAAHAARPGQQPARRNPFDDPPSQADAALAADRPSPFLSLLEIGSGPAPAAAAGSAVDADTQSLDPFAPAAAVDPFAAAAVSSRPGAFGAMAPTPASAPASAPAVGPASASARPVPSSLNFVPGGVVVYSSLAKADSASDTLSVTSRLSAPAANTAPAPDAPAPFLMLDSSFDAAPTYWTGASASSDQPPAASSSAWASSSNSNSNDDYYVNPEDLGFARDRHSDA